MTAGQRLRAERLRGGCDGGTKTDPSGLQKGPAYQAREDIPAETQQDLPEQDCAAGDPGFCWKGRGRQQVTWAERLSGDTSPAPPPLGKQLSACCRIRKWERITSEHLLCASIPQNPTDGTACAVPGTAKVSGDGEGSQTEMGPAFMKLYSKWGET